MDDMRDRLIELHEKAFKEWCHCNNPYISDTEYICDYLIANGVILPPCKVGDTIYFDTYKHGESIGIQPHKVANINIVVSTERPYGHVGADIYGWNFGKTVFLTREEAEKAVRSDG